jgi:hypothetical protein
VSLGPGGRGQRLALISHRHLPTHLAKWTTIALHLGRKTLGGGGLGRVAEFLPLVYLYKNTHNSVKPYFVKVFGGR